MESHLVISSGRKEALMKPSNIYLSRSCSRPSCILAELYRLLHHVTRRFHGTSHPSRKLLLSILPQLTSKTALLDPASIWTGRCDTTRFLGGVGPLHRLSLAAFRGALRTLLGCQYQPLFKNRQRWNAKCLLHTVQGHTLLTSTVTEMTTTRTCWCFESRIPLRLDAHSSPPTPHPLPHLTSGTRAGCLAAEIPPAIGWAGVDAIQLNA